MFRQVSLDGRLRWLRGVHGVYAGVRRVYAERTLYAASVCSSSPTVSPIRLFREVLDILRGVPRFRGFRTVRESPAQHLHAVRSPNGCPSPLRSGPARWALVKCLATLSPRDGFHPCEFWLVRDTSCPAAVSWQPFNLEYVAYASSSSTPTGALSARHEYEYCDVCVNRSDDKMLDVCFQVSQRLTSDPTTTPQQSHKEIDNAANRADQ